MSMAIWSWARTMTTKGNPGAREPCSSPAAGTAAEPGGAVLDRHPGTTRPRPGLADDLLSEWPRIGDR